jgi:transcriptional regulator with XRE-family HTH domain
MMHKPVRDVLSEREPPLKPREVARQIQVGESTLYNFLSGSTRGGDELIKKLSLFLGIPKDEIDRRQPPEVMREVAPGYRGRGMAEVAQGLPTELLEKMLENYVRALREASREERPVILGNIAELGDELRRRSHVPRPAVSSSEVAKGAAEFFDAAERIADAEAGGGGAGRPTVPKAERRGGVSPGARPRRERGEQK